MANPLIPPPTNLQTDQPPMNALIPPMPPTSPSMGFQLWASDPNNAHKVVPSMTDPTAPLQPNHPANGGMASVNPPKAVPAFAIPPGTDPIQTMAAANPKGLIRSGNLNIWNRPTVQNTDGSHSSEYSISYGDDAGHEVLIPTIVNGKFLTPNGQKPPEGSPAEKQMFQRAIQYASRTGQNLGVFDNPDDADAYANNLHNRGNQPFGTNAPVIQRGAQPPALNIAGMAHPLMPPVPMGGSGTVLPASAAPPNHITTPPPVQMPPAPPQLAADQQKLHDLQQSGAGLNQIKNPLLHGLAKAGDILAPFLIGGGAAAIPGTTLHNRYLQRETEGNIANEQAAYKDAQQTALNQATLNKTNVDTQLAPQNADAKRTAMLGVLAKQGMKLDDNGMPVVDTESPAYQKQQLQNDLLTAQTEEKRARVEVDQANAALQQAKTAGMDPNSPQFKLLLLKAQTAQQNANAAGERAKAYWGRYLQSAYNTGLNGDVLPGAMITDSGQVVGTGNAQNVRPTGTQRNKGNMAESADQQIQDMESIVAKRPDIFGPAAGRTTDFQTWLGSQDPDAQRFRAARTIAGDHLAGTFGGRSEAALSALDSAIGRFRDNPAAVKAGLDQLREANQLFLKAGTVRTVGSKNQGNFSSNNPLVPPKGNGGVTEFTDGGVKYRIPNDQVAAFKKDHPNAR